MSWMLDISLLTELDTCQAMRAINISLLTELRHLATLLPMPMPNWR
jgi:hypothetical protein